MAKPFVQEILPNTEVAGAFVVTDKQLRTARNGMPFLTLKLADRTGEMTARIWERADESDRSILRNTVVFVKGRAELFRDELQLQVQEITTIPRNDFDPSDFLPVCPHDTRDLLEELHRMTSSVKRRPLQRLLRHILDDAQLMGQFKLAPAAKSMHHAYLGGLLEHTVSVAVLVSKISSLYPDLDRDLLVVGALLHDIGKIHEFDYDVSIDYSDAGRLLGHMVLGVEILEDKVRGLRNFPRQDALLLKHLILSHHGETDFGAVRLPMTREAFALHLADDLDAKMNGINRILSESRGANEAWTAYQTMYDRFFFRGVPSASDASPSPAVEPAGDRGIQLNIWTSKDLKKSET